MTELAAFAWSTRFGAGRLRLSRTDIRDSPRPQPLLAFWPKIDCDNSAVL